MLLLIDELIDFIYISGKPEKAAIVYLAGDLKNLNVDECWNAKNELTVEGLSV